MLFEMKFDTNTATFLVVSRVCDSKDFTSKLKAAAYYTAVADAYAAANTAAKEIM